MKVPHSFCRQYCYSVDYLLKLFLGGISASMISLGVTFFCLGLTKSVIRWRFLGDLRFGWFSGDLFLMKVNADGTTFGFNILWDVQS